jgi:tRNA 2-thiouridine synthesizing protein A
MTEQVFDYSGLRCPLPVLKLAKAMKAMAPGEVVAVLATDPGAVDDFAAYCRESGNELLGQMEEAGVYRFRIRKA